jgi:PKD repeat protein
MSAKTSVNRTMFSIGIVTLVLILSTVSASAVARPSSRVVQVQEQASGGPLVLDAVVSNQTLIGTLTVVGKDDQPWMDMRGQVYLLDSSEQRLAIIPLEPLAPGEFRLIAPLGRLTAPGYLDIQLPDAKANHVSRAVYRVDPAGPVLEQVTSLPSESAGHGPLAIQVTGGPDAFGYTWDDTAAYGWIDTSGGTPIAMRDDDYAGPLPIGFTFNYYGKSYTQFYLDSNGFLSFADNGRSFVNYSKYGLPSLARPNNVIAPFWEDFDPSQGGTIRYQTKGSAPNRTLVVEWSGVPLYGDPITATQSVQVVLYEGSNRIRFQYPNTRSETWGDLRDSTVGIENEAGTIGLTYPYTIPVGVNKAVLFSYSRPTYNVFLTPDRQGGSAAAGSSAAFHLLVTNLGSSSDTYTMSRVGYTGSDWAVSFHQSDGVTPLPGNSTGSIAAGDQKDIVVKVSVPGGANVGNWTRATVRAQGSGGAQSTATVDAMLTPSFYQAYTDNDSGDGTEDSENYIDPIVNGENRTRRLTTDQDDSAYAGTASTPDGNAVIVWNRTYRNSNSKWVSEIEYAVVSPGGGWIQSITRLTNNSAATQKTYDFSPAAAVVTPTGNILIDWELQVDSSGDGVLDRYNAWYAILTSSGATVKAATALTNNTNDYPRDYPPSVTALTGGNFLLTWEHAAAQGGAVDIYYTVLSSSGNVVRPTTQLTSGGLNVTPRAASFPNGKAAIVWTSHNSYGNGEIYYAVLNTDGTIAGSLTPITTNGNSASSMYADAAALSDGRLAVAWTQAATDLQTQYTIVTGNPSPPGQAPQAGFASSSPDTVGETTIFTNTTTGTEPISYLWAFGDGATSTTKNPTHPYAAAGTYTVWLTATNSYGVNATNGTVQITSPGFTPQDGHWTGNTSRSRPMSFNISLGGTRWNTFTLQTDGLVGSCNLVLTTTVLGPSVISNNQFSWSGSYFSFSGQFNSTTTASGSYAYNNYNIAGCGNFTQSGTWTASIGSASTGIHGRVTAGGSGVGSLTLNLMQYDGVSERAYMTTTTQSDGSYSYVGASGLTSGQYYYVRYLNGSGGNPLNTSYMAYWFGPSLYSYMAGTDVSGGDFDIIDIPLVSPPGGTNQTIPAPFQWMPRGVAGDYYRWAVRNLSTSSQCLGPYQTSGSFTLDSTGFSNCVLTYNTQYGWSVYAAADTNMDSFGASLYRRTITFTTGLASMQGGVGTELLLNSSLNGQVEPRKEHVLGSLGIQRPTVPQTIYTVPNAINNWNIYVSLVADSQDHLIMTWLDSSWYNPFSGSWLVTRPMASYLFYALADKSGNILTPATILQRTRRSYLWSSWNGYGNAYMPPPRSLGQLKVYLPVLLNNYPPPVLQVVTNGGFEETPDLKGWTSVGSGKLAPKVVSAPMPHSSARVAVLGYLDAPCQSEPHGDSSLSQSIQVPNSGSPQLSLFYRIKTYDRLVGDKYDWFAVYINGALVLQTGRISQTPIAGCVANPYDTGWQQFTYDLSPYRGQTIEIRLANHTSDQWYNTWTYVDDVSVN